MSSATASRSLPQQFSIGNCKVEVEVEGDGLDWDSKGSADSLVVSFSNMAKIRILEVKDLKRSDRLGHCKPKIGKATVPLRGYSFLLVNPKDVDSHNKCLVEEIFNIYGSELPSMAFAANTGKESSFVRKCVSNGKYRTLVLKSVSAEGPGHIIAAISYQIIPADTQFAEIPLAAVSSDHQNKGIGSLLFKELKKRLQGVGVTTIFCWTDKESDGFWVKQGFLSIGCVDNKGRARRLPIKADIRRALCFPGCSMLMVTHLKTNLATPVMPFDSNIFLDSNPCLREVSSPVEDAAFEGKCGGFSLGGSKHQSSRDFIYLDSVDAENTSKDKYKVKDHHETHLASCTCSQQSAKRQVQETSVSLNSKRVKACHHINGSLSTDFDNGCNHGTNESSYYDCLSDEGKTLAEAFPPVSLVQDSTTLAGRKHAVKAAEHQHHSSDAQVHNILLLKENIPTVMFMDIADQSKKETLVKIVEELGGSVTCNGGVSTHVITGKARRTSNFCIALSSGAWIVSSRWLKESFRVRKFIDESDFLLEDPDYTLKYKIELKNAVARSRATPNGLLKGYQICVGKHVQPSSGTLSPIIEAAGGIVIRRLCTMLEPSKTIFVACEEDMEEALVAAKKGVWTYNSEWFMSCIMKQQLDFETPQFAESL